MNNLKRLVFALVIISTPILNGCVGFEVTARARVEAGGDVGEKEYRVSHEDIVEKIEEEWEKATKKGSI
ncbi:MAG: hypothetical protein OXU73_00845 [Candidatus Campbellbacteria bacterium]|nr:hypothetical protein [Candidatus Campbellbacteria bacterium]